MKQQLTDKQLAFLAKKLGGAEYVTPFLEQHEMEWTFRRARKALVNSLPGETFDDKLGQFNAACFTLWMFTKE